MRILAPQDQEQIKTLFADVEFVENDADIVFLSHIAQTMPRQEVVDYLASFKPKLREGGQIFVSTPSLDWIAKSIALNDNPRAEVYLALYGSPSTQHLSGFTLLWLRMAVAAAGYIVLEASMRPYILTIGAEDRNCAENLVIAVKRTPDAAEAITV